MNQYVREQGGAKVCLQHSSGNVWVSGSGSKWSPWTRGRESPDNMLSKQEGRKGNFLGRTCAVKDVKEPPAQYIWFS